MAISLAQDDASRAKVQRFLSEVMPGIAHNAVPVTRVDHLFRPVIVQCTNDLTGEVLGAALTCRSQKAAASMQFKGGDPLGLRDALDTHSELDLMAVAPNRRGAGVGPRLLARAELELRSMGVKAWFGNITKNLDVPRASKFYMENGFTIGKPGAPLPKLLGKDWTIPNIEKPAVYFWKMLN